MYSKIVWCYLFVLTLSDISLNTKLSAQGKSHGVTVHESLIEGLTFQEWGGAGGAVGVGVEPRTLSFGRAALGTAHARSVTLTNLHNTTLHLASVAGTTPDFHASFFDAKTLPPQGNTTFSVVYLGRREGPVAAHLYIHTSLGVHNYPVSAVGVASGWGVWPLVGVRVPHNATLDPLLTVHNPTDQPIQVREVYSSGGWLGLRLPGGGGAAPRALWTLPPHATTPLVRLRLQPPPHHAHPLTAYIRIKGDMPGGALVVAVEARGAAAGEYLRPLQLRLRPRGSHDPPYTVEVEAGNSGAGAGGVRVEPAAWGARCLPAPHSPPHPLPDAHAHTHAHNGQPDKPIANGVASSAGVTVSTLRDTLAPLQPPAPAAALHFDFGEMWASAGLGAGGEAWCAGWLRLGRAALPYSVRLLPGTLALRPAHLDFLTTVDEETGVKADITGETRELRVRNEFSVPVLVARLDVPHEVLEHFDVEASWPRALAAGEEAAVARLRARRSPPAFTMPLTLHTNLSDYTLPLRIYDPRFILEWEWPNSSDGTLRLGTVGTSSTRRVALRLRNAGPATLCVESLRALLGGASLEAEGGARCVEAGGAARAWLTVVAPAREGELRGAVRVAAGAGAARAPVLLRAAHGRLRAMPLLLPRAAPYAWSSAPLVLENTMAVRMRVLGATLEGGADEGAEGGAWAWLEGGAGLEVGAGRAAVGAVTLAPERLCAPHCYTGLLPDTPEGLAWEVRARSVDEAALEADAALQRARYALYTQHAAHTNVTLHLHTDHVVQVGVRGSAAAWWPGVGGAGARPAAGALAGVGLRAPLRVLARNPSRSHPLLLHAVLAHRLLPLGGAEESSFCSREQCVWSREAFTLDEWRATRGEAREWQPSPASPSPTPTPSPTNATHALPVLLLAPDAEVEFKITFAPMQPVALAAVLYLRNNLTVTEAVVVAGRGALASFELGGRRPGARQPFLFEVSECAEGAPLRRTLLARNTGRVAVRLRDWRLAGQPCQARGFSVQPCAPLVLQPNESRALTLAFYPDCTLARVSARLSLFTDTDQAEFSVGAQTAARLLAVCGGRMPRPPFEAGLRLAGTLLALGAFVLVLAAGALDAERELRRARAGRAPPPPAPRRPLDLRAAHRAPPAAPAPPPPAPPRRRRAPRRPLAPLDPHAERRAFERWRAEVLRHADDNGSSEDADADVDVDVDPDVDVDVDVDVDADADVDVDVDLDVDVDVDVGVDLEVEGDPSRPRVDSPPAERDDLEDGALHIEERPPGSGDEDAASTGSSVSSSSCSPGEGRERGGLDDYHGSDGDEDGSGSDCDSASASASPAPAPAARSPLPAARARAGAPAWAARGAARKDKGPRRRARPAAAAPRAAPPAPPERAPPALRWGASWSSVVAAAPPLAPIGSDVRRRAEPEPAPFAQDNSLFYYNDPQHVAEPEYSWRAPGPPTPTHYREESSVGAGGGAFGAVGAAAGGAGAGAAAAAGAGAGAAAGGAWDAAWWGAVRPPPGFSAAARPVRPYDPFHSLAAIWAPGAAPPWREDPPDSPPKPH